MLMIALAIVTALFALLLVGRVAGARRVLLLERWPSVVLGLAAVLAIARGQIWFAIGLAAAAALAWVLAPRPVQRRGAQPRPINPEEAAARRILGVGPNATAEEIRAAYRAKIATAHPDKGGTHADAARLTAARDRLLKR